MNNNNINKIINNYLNSSEEGASIDDILNKYPNYKNELVEIFKSIKIIKKQKKSVKPSRQMLINILSQLPLTQDVTNQKVNRYINRDKKKEHFSFSRKKNKKGRLFFSNQLNLTNLITMNKKICIGALIAVVLIILISIGILNKPRKQQFAIDYNYGNEINALSNDISELKKMAEEDTVLQNLDEDLLAIINVDLSDEKSIKKQVNSLTLIDVSGIEQLAEELNLELNNLSTDLSDLKEFESDNSLNDIDSNLLDITS